MKIAVPVKTNQENPIVSPLFGKAKWFAFVENGEVRIVPNEYKSGLHVVEWLLRENIDALIVQHIGESPYSYLKEASDIPIFYAGDGRISLKEAIEKFDDETLLIIDDTNVDQFVKHH